MNRWRCWLNTAGGATFIAGVVPYFLVLLGAPGQRGVVSANRAGAAFSARNGAGAAFSARNWAGAHVHALTLRAEEAQEFHAVSCGAAKPVGCAGVELGSLSGFQDEVFLSQDDS